MKTIKLARVIREGAQNFWRDKWLTLATVVIMSLSLYLIGIAIFLGFGVLQVIDSVESRINVSMYFDFTVEENKILEIKKELEEKSIEQIESVTYISREQALSEFMEREKDSKEIQEALDMIGENPLPASLIIVANNTADYDSINAYLYQEYDEYIMNTNLDKNKDVIGELQNFIVFVRNGGILLGVLFGIIAVMVTLNTIRMSLYAHRKEFEIMRLVGASNLYIKMPTLIEGVLYGFASAVVTSIFLVITVYAADPFARNIIENVNIAEFYSKNMFEVIMVVILLGVTLGFVSSYIAVHKYLEK
ncbi:MAG: permease-like cell division protein FtsX [Patescibacteria group bacterium]|nr:permease-like cell division protein FtsX [Patescibacteria group bacterium]